MLGSGDEPDPLVIKRSSVEIKSFIIKVYHQSQKGKISTHDNDYTAKLLNLEDVIIANVENISDELHIYLELPRTKHRCPACGALTDRVHDYRMQAPPLARNTFLRLRKRRYSCECGKRFFGKNTFLPRYYRATSRMVEVCNNKTKALKRACFGMRNFRNRILFRNT